MKLFTTLCFSFFFGALSFSQTIDSRLLEKYSKSELNEMIENSPNDYAILDYALDNGMYYSIGSNPKAASLPTIDLPEEGATFLDLNLEITSSNQYFKINGEDKILVVKSKWVLNHEMENK